MRLLLIQSLPYVPALSGAGKANRALMAGLAARGHECRAVVTAPGGREALLAELACRGLAVTASAPGVEVFRCERVEVFALTDRHRLRQVALEQIRELAPDCILVSSEDPGQELLAAALEAGAGRVVSIVHTPLHLPFGPRSVAADERKGALLRRAAGVLTVSRYVQDYLDRWGGVESAVIPFPVYGQGPFPRFGRFDEGFVTLVNPCDYKGLPIFAALAAAMPRVSFAAVPTWGTTAADRAALARLPNVTLLPPADDIDEIFARTRVLLMPSLWAEAFPLLPVEAMLRGIPVLASDVDGLAEAKLGVDYILPVRPIERYESRFDDRGNPVAVVPEQDAGAWRAALGDLLASRPLYDRLSAASREAALAFVSRLGIEPFEEFLERLAPRPDVATRTPPGKEDGGLAAEIGALSADRRALLALRALQAKKRQGEGPAASPAIPRREPSAVAPLSFEQERLWFLEQLEPESSAYSEMGTVRLLGSLDRKALAGSLRAIAERHEILRTTFHAEDGIPVQVIAPQPSFLLVEEDLGGLPAAELGRRLHERLRTPFDLSRGPLLRAVLYRLAAAEHALAVVVHHIVADGWSLGVFIRELAALYRSAVLGEPPSLPPLPLQYADFALWQRQRMAGAVLEEQLAYWRRRLAGAPPVLELPADRPRPALPSGRGGVRLFALPGGLAAALKALANRTGATPFMVLLAAFDALLYRSTGQRDLSLGTDVANRDRSELEPLIGFFVNQLVLRVELAGELTFSELIARVRRITLEAFAHQSVPFAKVVEALQPERDLAVTPLFQAMFALQNAPLETLALPGMTLEPLEIAGDSAKFELVVVLAEREGRLNGFVEYATDLFDGPTIERLLDRYRLLLEAMAAAPEDRLLDPPLLSATERHQSLVEWNDSGFAVPAARFDELFAARARSAPGAVAAVHAGSQVSYGELDRAVSRAACRLAAHDVRPETVVALLAERGIGLLTAILGVFRAGGAYLPLDPNYPPRRLLQVLERSGAPLVVVTEGLRGLLDAALALSPPAGRPVVLGLTDLLREGTVADLPALPVEPDLAYVIYTSGSTGVPKGAAVTQAGMVNHLCAKIRDLTLGPGDVVAQTASQCFDISVWQSLVALLTGGRTCIVPDEIVHDAGRLLDEIEAAGVTVLETVPSLLRVLLEEVERRGEDRPPLRALRWLMPTGEALPADLCRRWLHTYPRVPLVNAYGPTECSDDVTHQLIRVPPAEGATGVPIGRPVANLRLHVLDARMRPAPIGIAGELHAGGAGVGRGYRRDPGRTAESFVPDLFSPLPGGRLYRTGDLARWRTDGALEFLGRIDQQVKVRGFRIELGEIEAVLAGHPAVREGAVIVSEETPGAARLIAYVVPDRDAPAGDEGLGGLEREKVGQWRTIFDEVYGQGEVAASDAAMNLRLWVDSYTGEPLPEEEIRECVEDSVGRILALRPRRVLEIGCGTGLLLERIAPHCASYWATDLSGEVLRDLGERMRERREALPDVHLLQKGADDLAGLPERAFDLVVLNEVVQYFPDVEYLVRVLTGALGKVFPGGFVFIGGVRNRALIEAFHASVQLHQSPDSLPAAELSRRVRTQVSREKELLVSPGFWSALQQRLPGISEVGIEIKGGRSRNELTKFRYDVVLRVGGEGPAGPEARWLDWRGDGLTLDGLRRLLREEAPAALGVSSVPNARLETEVRALRWLAEAPEGAVAGDFRLTRAPGAVDPEEIRSLARELACRVDICWSGSGGDGRIDLLFRRLDASPPTVFGLPRQAERPQPWGHYANDPLQGLFAERMAPQLRAFLAERLPEYMVPAVFVPLESLPLSANGKLDRRALPPPESERPDLAASFVAPRTAAEETLARIWAEVLRLGHVGVHDNFFSLGGDSILSMQIVARASQAGLRLTPRQVFQHQTVAELAAVAGTSEPVRAEQGTVTGAVPLTPIQQWFFELDLPVPGHFNLAVFLAVAEPLDPSRLARALRQLLLQHDALRLRFTQEEGIWTQRLADAGGPVPFTRLDLSALPEARLRHAVGRAAAQVQESLDLTRGPVVRAAAFDLGAQRPGRLLITVHHLAVDGVSWRILLEDLETAYRRIGRGEEARLPAKTTSFRSWARRLAGYARTAEVEREAAFWLSGAGEAVEPLPIDFPDGEPGAGREASARRISLGLSEEATRGLLHEVPAVYGTRIGDVLLTAFAEAFARWTGRRRLRLDLESHGRESLFEDVDLSRTVGWFTAVFPVLLDLPATGGPQESLVAVKEQLRRVPAGGVGYGLLRYSRAGEEVAERLRSLPRPEVLFNYLGQLGGEEEGESALFARAPEAGGPVRDPRGARSHLLQVDCSVAGGRLLAEWTYSCDRHRRSTIEALARGFFAELEILIEHCRTPGTGAYTPSDFPEADLDEDDFATLMARLSR